MNQTIEIVRFTVPLDGWSAEYEIIPIKSHASNGVIGGATIMPGPVWACFIAKSGYYESLGLSMGDKTFITPVLSDKDGSIIELTLSSFTLGDYTKPVTLQEEISNEF